MIKKEYKEPTVDILDLCYNYDVITTSDGVDEYEDDIDWEEEE